MKVTISLPDKLYQQVVYHAQKKNIGVDEFVTRAVSNAILEESSNFQAQVKIIKQSTPFCSDKKIIELSNLQMSEKVDKRLSLLIQKQNEKDLTDKEEKDFWKLMELNRLMTLRKAVAIREISRRNL